MNKAFLRDLNQLFGIEKIEMHCKLQKERGEVNPQK
jgi:hypothetical protein